MQFVQAPSDPLQRLAGFLLSAKTRSVVGIVILEVDRRARDDSKAITDAQRHVLGTTSGFGAVMCAPGDRAIRVRTRFTSLNSISRRSSSSHSVSHSVFTLCQKRNWVLPSNHSQQTVQLCRQHVQRYPLYGDPGTAH